LHGQMEQLSNARALKMLGLAHVMPTLDQDTIQAWLSTPGPSRQRYPDVANAVVDWIVSGDWHDPGRLAHQLWAQISPDAPDVLPIPAM